MMLALMLFGTTLLAKENKVLQESLDTALETYKELQVKGDMEKTLEYIYPPVFTITPKKILLQSFKMAEESGKMPKIIAFNVERKQTLIKYDKGVYTLLPYSVEMTMDLTPPVTKENKDEYAKVEAMLKDPKQIEAYKKFTLNILKMSLGKDTQVDSKEGSLLINIKKSSKLLAINENNAGWKFIEADPQAIALVKSVIPKEIVENEKEIFSEKVLTQEEQMKQMMEMMKQ